MWYDYKGGKVYISNDYDKETSRIFSITKEDNKPNVMMLKALKKYHFWKSFESNFSLGIVCYENFKIKTIMQDIIRIVRAY